MRGKRTGCDVVVVARGRVRGPEFLFLAVECCCEKQIFTVVRVLQQTRRAQIKDGLFMLIGTRVYDMVDN